MKPPCKNCITLGMCRGKYITEGTTDYYSVLNLTGAIEECSILHEYCSKDEKRRIRIKKIKTMRRFFNTTYVY